MVAGTFCTYPAVDFIGSQPVFFFLWPQGAVPRRRALVSLFVFGLIQQRFKHLAVVYGSVADLVRIKVVLKVVLVLVALLGRAGISAFVAQLPFLCGLLPLG